MKLLGLSPVTLGALALCLPLAALAALCGLAAAQGADRPAVRQSGAQSLTGFVENKGQWEEGVLFHARAGGIGATLLADALVLRPLPELARELDEDGAPARHAVADTRPPLVIRLPRAASVVEGEGAFATKHHFFVGERHATNALGYGSVLYREIAPGIDLRVRMAEKLFHYDLIVEPGARLSELELAIEGASSIERASAGVLAMQTPFGLVEQRIGPSWQEDAQGAREALVAEFRAMPGDSGALRYGFAASGWDVSKRLVIDPGLVYATYVGGPGQDWLVDMEVGADGAVYLLTRPNAGSQSPTTPGSVQQSFVGGGNDAWIGKLSPGGASLEWGTYLGGSHTDTPVGLALDTDGTLVVAGSTWSFDFPTTPGCLQAHQAGTVGVTGGSSTPDFYATRLAPAGDAIVWSTLLGNPSAEVASALTLQPSGEVILAGEISSGSPLPGTPGAYDPVYNVGDDLLLGISGDGSTLRFYTYFRASNINDMTRDTDGNIYFAGNMNKIDEPLPTTPGVLQPVMHAANHTDAYVAKLSPDGSHLIWSTYFGGAEGRDTAWGIALDAARAVYMTGSTSSPDFPVTPGAFDMLKGSAAEIGFVAKLLPDASDLVWSTYLGPCCAAGGVGYTADIAVDIAGNAHVQGFSNESPWPTTADAFQPSYHGPFPKSDANLAKFDAFGEKLLYSTWFGGNGTEGPGFVGLDESGRSYLGVDGGSSNLPMTPGAYDTTYAGGDDLAVAAFDLPLLPWRVMPGALKGAKETPVLAGGGLLAAGQPTRLSVRGAPAGMPAWGVAGFSQIHLPLLGGTLLPFPDLVVPLKTTNGQGALDVHFDWPGLVSGSELHFQIWVLDLGAPQLVCATNALMAISQ